MAPDLDAQYPTVGARPESTWRANAWFLVVIAVTIVAYGRSFTAAFQFDDHGQILHARVLQDPTWGDFLLWGRTRIIPVATLALNYWVNGGNPFWYHVVNFVVHLLTCFVVYRLALALCQTPRLRGTWLAEEAQVFALTAALIFASHPIQVQAVTYIVQRMSSMAALFYLSAVLGYVRCRIAETTLDARHSWIAYAAALALATAASLSKENTASLPVAILLVEWVFFGGRGGWRRFLRRWVPFVLLALAMPIAFWALDRRPAPPEPTATAPAGQDSLRKAPAAAALGAQPQPVPGDASVIVRGKEFAATLQRAADAATISPRSYFLTECLVLPRYLRLSLFPWGLNVDHDVPLQVDVSPATVVALTFLLGLLGFGVYAARRWPVVGFGVLWFFVAHSIESTAIPIRDVMNEHRMYLAMPGIALVAAAVFAGWRRRAPRPALVAGGLIIAALTLATIQRNEVWQTQLSLWQDALAKSPSKTRVHMNLGTAFFMEGDYRAAINHYCEVLRLDPKDRFAEGYIQLALTELMDAEDGTIEFEMAKKDPDGTLELVPRHPCPDAQKRVNSGQ